MDVSQSQPPDPDRSPLRAWAMANAWWLMIIVAFVAGMPAGAALLLLWLMTR